MEQGGSREGRDFGPGMEARLTFAQWESRNAVPVMTEEQYWAVKAKMQQETERATRQAEFYNEATKAKDTHGLKSEVLPQPKSPEWPSIFDRLQGSNKALDELHEAIMQLEERLNPVLKPNPAVPGDGVNGCAMPPVSVINEELSNRVERLRLITGRIWDIHSRIDL